MMKVEIDGVEYVPAVEAIPSADLIMQVLVCMFWGSSIPDYTTLKREAEDLFVEVTNNPAKGRNTSVAGVVAEIVRRISEENGD
jgi:hypothetical protein